MIRPARTKIKDNPVSRVFLGLKDRTERLMRDKRIIAILVLAMIAIFYFGTYFKKIFFIALLTLIGSFSTIYLKYIKEAYVLGVELCMFATLLCARAYGPGIGAFVGFVTIFFSLIIGGRFKYSSFISVLALPLIGFISGFLTNIPILWLGVGMTLVYDAIIIPLYILLGSRVTSSVIFVVTHVIFNYWMFRDLAPFMLRLMG